MSSIAFVGAGPTTLYALNALVSRGARGARITIFESQERVGLGTPYRPGWNDPAMLSNIASAEIPPVTETLLGWLQAQSATELAALGIDVAAMNDRAFVPRVVLGRYFESQFTSTVERAISQGARVDVWTQCQVVDAANRVDGLELTIVSEASGETTRSLFDHVVLATGHQWPSRQEVRPGYFASPWPAATLTNIPATEIGIRGSSLTAIDVAVALACRHGAFHREADALIYALHPGAKALSLTMMSRKGLLPEADFYFPLPHGPLQHCTEAAIEDLVNRGGDGLLDAVFALFLRELQDAAPEYVDALSLTDDTLETFGDAYFAARAAADPFEWAAANLAEARANHATQTTVAWRDAILRMHEVVAAIVPHLDTRQFERFGRHFKPVFVDAYGAVPHTSVERMLALHRAGVLNLLTVGDDYQIDTHCDESGAVLVLDGESRRFPVFIEATGQRPLGAIQFPFLSLIEQGIIRDEASADATTTSRGIAIDDLFHPMAEALPADRLFCLSLPFILGRHPFAQGITSSHQMGEIVGEALARAVAERAASVDSFQDVA